MRTTRQQRHYSKEDLAQRWARAVQSQIRQQVKTGNEGKIVAIDVETENFVVY
jgi:hypothetical protein